MTRSMFAGLLAVLLTACSVGAVIGGAAGAVGGTAVAIHYAYRDVIVSAHTPITLTLSQALRLASK